MSAASSVSHLSPYFRSGSAGPPRHLGRRYDRSGTFLPEPGNTVVCHLVDGSATQQALFDARKRYLAMPGAEQLAMTPAASLHMTLFQGIIEYRRLQPYWPADVSTEASIDEMTAIYLQRLKSFPGGPAFDVKVTAATPTGLAVEGASAADRTALKRWRDDLAAVFGYRHPDHDSYPFHITFGYMIEALDDAFIEDWRFMLEDVVAEIGRRPEVLELRAPAFCAFSDMKHFEELLVLPVTAEAS